MGGSIRPRLRGRVTYARCRLRAPGLRLRRWPTRLCGTSGLWNVNLGYGNEAIATAVAEALREPLPQLLPL